MEQKKKAVNVLRHNYTLVLERSFGIALLILCTLFYLYPRFYAGPVDLGSYTPPDELIDVVRTVQEKPRPRPAKPMIPVETENDEFLEEITVDFLDLQEDWLVEKPKVPQVEEPDFYPFYAVSEPPVLIHRVHPEYPPIARDAGIEGTVVVTVHIATDGSVERAKIFKSIPMLDEAALEAAGKLKFKPGRQRDKYVRVWMNVPFKFSIRGGRM